VTQPPLFPYGVGDRLGTGFRLFAHNFVVLLRAIGVVCVPLAILMGALQWWLASVVVSTANGLVVRHFDGTVTVEWSHLRDLVPAVTVTLVAELLIAVPANAIAYQRAADSFLGIDTTWAGSLQRGLRRIGSVLWIGLLIDAALLAGAALLAMLAGGYVLGHLPLGLTVTLLVAYGLALSVGWIWWSVATKVSLPVLMAENLRGVAALRRSISLVQARWWPTFGITLLIGIILGALGFAVSAFTGIVASVLFSADPGPHAFVKSFLGQFASMLVVLPISSSMFTTIYVDLRVRAEGVDLPTLTEGRSLRAAPGAFGFLSTPPLRPSYPGPVPPPTTPRS